MSEEEALRTTPAAVQGAESWGIVGGGVLGMTLAYRLARRGHAVTLFESGDQLGGLAAPWSLGDVVWDRHYHVILRSDRYLRELLAELGLEREIRWVETRTGFYTDGRLHSMSNGLEFLRFPPLGFFDKARLLLTILYASRIRDWKRLEQVPVEGWLRSWSGNRTFERIWLPLLRSKLGDSYRETSAAFIWATIARMYEARRTGLKKEMFGYVPGGYARILARFEQALSEAGVRWHLRRPARGIQRARAGGVVVEFGDGDQHVFDRVAVTVPAPLAAEVCTGLSSGERDRMRAVRYQGIVCASLLLRRGLSRFYITNITEPGVPFTAVIEMSALVDSEKHLGGHALVYLPKYVAPDDPLFSRSDAAIQESFLAALKRMHPRFEPEDVIAFRVSRVRQVFALTTLGYSSRLPPVETSMPGLLVVNSAHILNGTLNVNATLRLAEGILAGPLSSTAVLAPF